MKVKKVKKVRQRMSNAFNSNSEKLRAIIKVIVEESGRLSRLRTSGMGTNHPFTVKSIKQALGDPGKYDADEVKEESKEKVKISRAFLK